MSPALFALCILRAGFHICVQTDLDHTIPIYDSCLAAMIAMLHHTQLLLIEMGVS
jgi:hypothetical protein